MGFTSFRSMMVLCVGVLFCLPAVAAEPADVESLEDLMQELQNLKASVASYRPARVQESPGIITVVTAEDIKRRGFRTLMEVLDSVPGFQFGLDVVGGVNAGVRGIWGAEGKVLFLMDGFELNERLFGSFPLMGRIPAELIERLEVIRGPGSALYGGFAELAVVKITTKSASGVQGGSVSGTYGVMEKTFGRRGASLAYGGREGQVRWDVFGSYYDTRLSDFSYTDSLGDTFSLQDQVLYRNAIFGAGYRHKGLEARFLGELYHIQDSTYFGMSLTKPIDSTFDSIGGWLAYTWKPVEKLSIVPKVSYFKQRPFDRDDQAGLRAANRLSDFSQEAQDMIVAEDESARSGLAQDQSDTRLTASLVANWDIGYDLGIAAGMEGYREYAREDDISGIPGSFSRGEHGLQYDNFAFLNELSWTPPALVNFTLGSRFEHHSAFGSSFVPRLAVTRAWDRFHAKAILNSAFRAPTVQNIDLSQDRNITPERTADLEFEFGCRVTDSTLATVNFFETRIFRPIVYISNQTMEGYFNGGRIGTRGFEAELRHRARLIDSGINFSYYFSPRNTESVFAVDQQPYMLLGFANYKAYAWGSYQFTDALRAGTSLSLHGPRYGYSYDAGLEQDAATGTRLGIQRFKPEWTWNANVRYQVPAIKGLLARFAINNILNQRFDIIQAYRGGNTPMPGSSREYVFQLAYDWK